MLRLPARASGHGSARLHCALCRAAFLFGLPLPAPAEVVTLAAGEVPCLFCGTSVPAATGAAQRQERAHPLLRL